jgi:hypothetical protein
MEYYLNYLEYFISAYPVVKYFTFFILIWFILKKRIDNLHSHWNTLIDNFNYSTQDFYNLLENELQNHDIENINTKEVTLREGGIGTDKRLYLRVTWKDLVYYVCAAPFGDGFFVSWWLKNNASIISIIVSKIPLFGGWLHRKLFPLTFYRVDTASMFMTYAQQSVLKVIREITKDQGIAEIGIEARKPMLSDIFKR